jgi:hypothetical protein
MSETDAAGNGLNELKTKLRNQAQNTPGLMVAAAAFLFGGLGVAAGVVLSRSAGPAANTAIEDLRERVDVLANETTGLRANSELLVSRLPSLALLQRATTLNFSERIYDKVDTTVGPLLVRLENVEPTVDGFRLTLGIGNVQSAAFEGFDLSLQWAEGNKRQSFSETLLPGRWTVVQAILAPATKEKTRSVTIEGSLDKVALYR